MGFEMSGQVRALNAQLQNFMDEHIYPRERDWHEWCINPKHLWEIPDWYDEIRDKAKEEGLWNLFLPEEYAPWSPGLKNVEIARSRCDIEQCRLLTLQAAEVMDRRGLDGARPYISMIKIVAPKMAQEVADRAMQIFGGMDVCQDTMIPEVFTIGRFCRIADGPIEVHMSQLAKLTARELTAH